MCGRLRLKFSGGEQKMGCGGPDCHFSKEFVGLGPIPARIRVVINFEFQCWPYVNVGPKRS